MPKRKKRLAGSSPVFIPEPLLLRAFIKTLTYKTPTYKPGEESRMSAMVRNIFLSLNGTSDPTPQLETALSAARRFDAGITAVLLDGTSPTTPALAGNSLAAGMVSGLATETRHQVHTRLEDVKGRLRALANAGEVVWSESETEAFFPKPGGKTPHLTLRLAHETLEKTLARYAQLTDLAVLPHPTQETDPLAHEIRNELLTQNCAPVLLAPYTPQPGIARRLAFAWDDTPASARALHAVLPWLHGAHSIILIHQPDEQEGSGPSVREAAAYLELHGHAPALYPYRADAAQSATTFLQKLNLLAADLLVIGHTPSTGLHALFLEPPANKLADKLADLAPIPVLVCG